MAFVIGPPTGPQGIEPARAGTNGTVSTAPDGPGTTPPTPTPTFPSTTEPDGLFTAADEEAIRLAVETAYNGFLPISERMTAVRDGSALVNLIESARPLHSPALDSLSAEVDKIRLVAVDKASYDVTLRIATSELDPILGSAVRVGGRWLVSRLAMCVTVEQLGISCPPDETDFPIDESVPGLSMGAQPGVLAADFRYIEITFGGLTTNNTLRLLAECPEEATAVVAILYEDGFNHTATITMVRGVPVSVESGHGEAGTFWFERRADGTCRIGAGRPVG